jgi:CBS domain containing-hemolysin-like protein
MLEIIVQLVVLLFVVIAAGLKSLRFAPSELTDFELERQVKQGKDAAIAEDRLRKERSLLLALQQLAILLLMVSIVVLLRAAYDFVPTIFFALLWLLVIEFLGARPGLRSFAEELADRHQLKILKVADFLRPILKFVTYKHVFDSRQATFYSKEELIHSLENDHGVLTKDEIIFIKHTLHYSNKKVKDVMTPRSEVVYVKKSDTVGPVLLDKLHKSGQTHVAVIGKDLDHVVGTLGMDDIMPLKPAIKTVADAMRPTVFYVNQDAPLDHALQAFLHTKHHLFIVVNKLQKTTGVITIDALLQQLVGHKAADGFNQYHDLQAVAGLEADGQAPNAANK